MGSFSMILGKSGTRTSSWPIPCSVRNAIRRRAAAASAAPASRNVLQVICLNQEDLELVRFQNLIKRDPVDAGSLHGNGPDVALGYQTWCIPLDVAFDQNPPQSRLARAFLVCSAAASRRLNLILERDVVSLENDSTKIRLD